MVVALKRGGEAFLRRPFLFLLGGLFWTLICPLTYWLLIGPALHGLFRVAFAVHRDGPVHVKDHFSAIEDPAAPIVAGLAFILPFQLYSAFDQPRPGILVFLFVHFAYFVYTFAVLADRRCSLAEAVRTSVQLADAGPAPRGRLSRLAQHVLFSSAILLGLLLVTIIPFPAEFPLLMIVAGPLAACVLSAWYLILLERDARGRPEADGLDAGDLGESLPAASPDAEEG